MVIAYNPLTDEMNLYKAASASVNPSGYATLVAGVIAISVPGALSTSKAFSNIQTPGGTIGATHKIVCSTDTVTITSIGLTGTTQTLDTSTHQYFVIL